MKVQSISAVASISIVCRTPGLEERRDNKYPALLTTANTLPPSLLHYNDTLKGTILTSVVGYDGHLSHQTDQSHYRLILIVCVLADLVCTKTYSDLTTELLISPITQRH